MRFAGRTETDVAADLADAAARSTGTRRSTSPSSAPGPNGANPHHEAGDRVIEEGDMVVLDFGGLMDGYGSDTTRTVHVGEPTDEEREVHEIVRARPAGRLRGRPARGRRARRSTAPPAR